MGQNLNLSHFFTQDRRPNGRLLAPTPLTLRGGEFATQITKTRRYAARKKLCATHTKNPVGLGVKIGGSIEWGDGSIWSKNFTY